eukprot:SAG31_NODE_2595_length_5421_cov_2.387636_1_plen_358_part_10
MEGMRQTFIYSGLTAAYAMHVSILAQLMVCKFLQTQLSQNPALPSSDVMTVQFIAQGMARNAANEADADFSPSTASNCQSIAHVVTQINEAARRFMPSDLPPKAQLPADLLSVSEQSQLPLFGRLRRDASVENLIGDAPVVPIEIPVEFTQMSDTVANHLEAATAMRDAVELCTLLAYQKDVIKNTYLHRAALIQHLFTRVIPLPMPDNHPEKKQRCFWANQQIRYADQADILRLLDMLCRQYCAVSLSLKVTRSFDAVRMLILGCMACIGDCVLRMTACDRPSKFSLHYAGNVDGPVYPFGFDMGYYALESETACFTEPELTTARTQLLDYFYQQRKDLRDDHIMFKFEEGLDLSAG